jgi:hypothetical protein
MAEAFIAGTMAVNMMGIGLKTKSRVLEPTHG